MRGATQGNFAWSLVAWKLGLTYMRKDATCCELRAAFKESQKLQRVLGDIASSTEVLLARLLTSHHCRTPTIIIFGVRVTL